MTRARVERIVRIVLIGLGLLGCTRSVPEQSVEREMPPADVPSLQVGEVTMAPGPCVRAREAWTCLDPDHPLLRQPEAVRAHEVRGGPLCMATAAGELTCVVPTVGGEPRSRSFADVDDFDLFGSTLYLIVDGRLGMVDLLGDAEPRFDDSATNLVDVEAPGPCTRRRTKALACSGYELDRVEQLCLSHEHFCAVQSGGEVVCAGDNTRGQLGLVELDRFRDAPERGAPVVGLPPAVHVGCGDGFSCALTRGKEVWCWGNDDDGRLGRGLHLGVSGTAAPVFGLRDAVGVELYDDFACAALADGTLSCWGNTPEHVPNRFAEQPPPRCVDGDLASWQRRLEAANSAAARVAILRELAIDPDGPPSAVGYRPPTAALVDRLRIHEVELDGAEPRERVVELHLRSEDDSHLRAVAAILYTDEGRWCRVEDQLAYSIVKARRPAEPLPGAPDFATPQELGFVPLTSADRVAIEVRRGHGDGDALAHYELRYYEQRERELVELFGPFVLLDADDDDLFAAPRRSGELTLTGEFPRTIETTLTTDCREFRRSCIKYPVSCAEDYPEGCKRGTVRETWTLAGRRYRRASP